MIYGRLDRLDRYRGLSARLDKALDFLKTQNLTALPAGKTVLDGEALFVNRFDYKTAQESVTEAHRAYTDIILCWRARNGSVWRTWLCCDRPKAGKKRILLASRVRSAASVRCGPEIF